ncbi:TorF family putative porin [Pseudoalteromonas sp. BDTF-M6]|uniref:TorF family putative porin n=1 Tax=Pseudoalteromonas sp. BDTF-M6 TaxID=2796132 RepID=UPI001BAE7E38|nr:TorF family putative porin [Pseudoalteromonas sp. BDTF-M6]MBS3799255.1 TorF family putative porin [Pseudoalteromonas sp. BDTF-M6]
MNKKKYAPVLALLALSLTPLASQAEVTANVAASSNYYWRGVTQSDDGAAVSGGIDYASDTGFYAGTWLSNIDFGDAASTSYEMDLYAGFAGSVDDIGYDVGYIYYAYPDAEGDIGFGEIYGSVSWQWLSAGASYLVNAEGDATDEEDMLYLELNASFTILKDTELALHFGHSSGDTVEEWYGEDDSYIDYAVSISKSGFTFGLLQTDLDADDDLKAYVSYSLDFEL